MTTSFFQIDAFTDRAFSGNPAAVCILPRHAEAGWMQDMAAEMNLSETAFLVQRPDGFDLRWFTPTVEVALCGHATLASAHALWESGVVGTTGEIRFFTASGELRASREDGLIWLDMPARSVTKAPLPAAVREAIGVESVWDGVAGADYVVEVASEEILHRTSPDFVLLKTAAAFGVIVTSAGASSEVDFVSRYFVPAAGIDEDPVTGSAHCALGPYWTAKLGKSTMRAHQASARGGDLRVRVADNRVFLGGITVTVVRGELS